MSTVKQWGVWVGIAAIAVMSIWLAADVIGTMFRQGQDALAVGFSLAVYGGLCWAGKEWRA